MVLNYISGATRYYYSPVKYLIFWTAIYFVLLPVIFKTYFLQYSLHDALFNSHRAFTSASFGDMINFGSFFMTSNTNVYLLCYAPFLAVASYFFHRKCRFNFAKTMIMMGYFCGQFSVVIIVGSLLPFVSDNAMVRLHINVVITTPALLYLFFKMQKQFYAKPGQGQF